MENKITPVGKECDNLDPPPLCVCVKQWTTLSRRHVVVQDVHASRLPNVYVESLSRRGLGTFETERERVRSDVPMSFVLNPGPSGEQRTHLVLVTLVSLQRNIDSGAVSTWLDIVSARRRQLNRLRQIPLY